ncbi:MAG: hypothetical protein GX605_06715 [Chloroflexi bacterium]|nr:hypothetical protein [Chloroflexota bacterium]
MIITFGRVRALWVIVGLSVLLRLGAALWLGDQVASPALLTDQVSYHTLAVRLLGGHGYSFDKGWYPFTQAEQPTAHWSFVYPLFVGAVYAVAGVHPLAVRVVQALLGGILLPLAAYRLTKAALPDSAKVDSPGHADSLPLAGACLAAFYGYFVLYAATIMTETAFLLCVLWVLERVLVLERALAEPQGERQLAALGVPLGFGLGLGVLLRQSLLPAAGVLLAYLLWTGWRNGAVGAAIRHVGAAVFIIAFLVLPWTARNAVVFGDFLPLNSNAGYAMFSAQHPLHGTRFQEFAAAPVPPEILGQPEPQMDRALLREGIRFVAEDPGRYLRLSLSRVRAFFEFWPTGDTSLLHNVGRVASALLLLPTLLLGLGLLACRLELVGRLRALILFSAVYTAQHVLTWAMVRYRLPVDAALLPVAALGMVGMVERSSAKIRRWRGQASARQVLTQRR